MRTTENINADWLFVKKDCGIDLLNSADGEALDLPFTWNGTDGQDGGGDYLRAAFWFVKKLGALSCGGDEDVYVEFKGVNSSAEVYLNGQKICGHDGGYSTFRAKLTPCLNSENVLAVRVDNTKNDKVYPQTADFTFYGGIYRDVNLITVGKNRFDMDYYGSSGIQIVPEVKGPDGEVKVNCFITGEGEAEIIIFDGEGKKVGEGINGEPITIKDIRLWNGVKDPYLYKAQAVLKLNGQAVDKAEAKFGFRTFKFDSEKGFFLNGESYPLRGVSRHQDRPKIGNALTKADHDEDMMLIKEIGANTVRLAHYQQDDYLYDLCDENGLVVWAEIPYISRHMPNANGNAVTQMKELIFQQYNHPSIVMWGISNEITMYRKHKKDMLAFHKELNALVKKLDPSRPTTLACFAMCGPMNKVAHITDIVAWNLYLGWYVPGFFLNDLWMGLYHALYKKSCLGYSEYGAECMPNLHSKKPGRGDNSEEYQTKYHEYMLRCFERHPYLWGTYVWNMFDFAADARNQGGEPGMNHKGLVTFDRKTKKDSFYLYKSYWSNQPFVYIAGKRFKNRTGGKTQIKVFTNTGNVTLTVNETPVKGKTKDNRVFVFKIKLAEVNKIRAANGEIYDECEICRVKKPDPVYKLHVKSETQSWQK